MGKKKKGYKEYIKLKNSQGKSGELKNEDVDFRYYAEEYSKLLDKKYHAVLNNDQKIEFLFKEGNFYHLLGFHKFVRTVFHYMITEKAFDYSQTNFYRDVLAGNIEYTAFNQEKIREIEKVPNLESFENFSEHEHTTDIKDVLYRRFPYFCYDNVIEILKNKIVIDFEQEQSISNVRANKIFYKFFEEVQRNLNLFLDDEGADYFTTSFFLENRQDMFKEKSDGQPMDMLDVLCLYIEDSKKYEPIDFRINWEVVTDYVVKKHNISVVSNLKKYFSLKQITEENVCMELEKVETKLHKLNEEIQECERWLKINELIQSFAEGREEEYALELMEYDIDVEEISLDKDLVKKQCENMRKRRKELNRNIKKIENKRKLLEKSCLEIHRMDILKMKSVYVPLLANSDGWADEFWSYALKNTDCFRKTIYPQKIKEIYLQWGR